MLETSMREIFAVGRTRGIAIPDGTVERSMAFTDTLAPGGTTSLRQDIADGKPSGLTRGMVQWCGWGGGGGVATPLNGFLYAALLPRTPRPRRKLTRTTL